jgi:hypothetical protein
MADRTFSEPKYFEPGGRSALMPAAFLLGARDRWRTDPARAQPYDKIIKH